MDNHSTDDLRRVAHVWSLDGDRKLLNLLKDVHKKVISNAADTYSKLNETISSLEEASITLQNVNNRFTALSKTQFVESRVFEDDTDIQKDISSSKISASVTISDVPTITDLSLSLNVLESFHEPLLLDVDSDSENDEISSPNEILELKDRYEDSLLPHLIGSENWKSKTHVGILEDSDHDVTDSESVISDNPSDADCSSSITTSNNYRESNDPLASWCEDRNHNVPESVSTKPVNQSDLAAELARKLGSGAKPHEVPHEKDHIPTLPATSNVFKPTVPSQGILIFDAPPAMVYDQSDTSDSEPEDIFAEINRTVPYGNRNKFDNHTRTDNNNRDSNIFSGGVNKPGKLDIDSGHTTIGSHIQKSPQQARPEKQSKKPAGAISLFGSKQGADSIGAAIINRNRKAPSSDDESNDFSDKSTSDNINEIGSSETNKAKHISVAKNKINKDILNKPTPSSTLKIKPADEILSSLFQSKTINNNDRVMKSQDAIDNPPSNVIKSTTNTTNKKIAWLDDDIFDDIDDLFMSQPKIVKVSNTNKKADAKLDDDLFGNVSKLTNKKEPIANSDDDLFGKITTQTNNTNEKGPVSKLDDDLFGNITKKSNEIQVIAKLNDDLFADQRSNIDDDLFSNSAIRNTDSSTKSASYLKSIFEKDKAGISKKVSDVLFGDDIGNLKDENIFSVIKAPTSSVPKQQENQNLQQLQCTEKDISHNIMSNEQLKVNTIISEPDVNVTKNAENITQDNNATSKKNIVNNSFDVSDDNSGYLNDINVNEIEDNTLCEVNTIDSTDTFEVKTNATTEPQENITQTQISNCSSSDSIETATVSRDVNEPIVISPPRIEKCLSNNKIDDIHLQENKSIIIEPQANLTSNVTPQGMLSDIINDIPPVLESDEPKKQTNINALFDDDFDDEELFFRKPVNITDEKPVLNKELKKSSNVFLDEPPDIDVVDDIFKKPKTKERNAVTETDNSNPATSQLFHPKTHVLNKSNTERENNDTFKNKEQIAVGKLKQPNININVQSLLPGASRDKLKRENHIKIENSVLQEGIIPKDINPAEHTQKTVSLNSESETLILNNSMSKERPKIQVKRRPSTRRARIEASRNSINNNNNDSNNDFYHEIHGTKASDTTTLVTKVDNEVLYDTQVLNINAQDTYVIKNPIQKKGIVRDSTNTTSDLEKEILRNVTNNNSKTSSSSDDNRNILTSIITSQPSHSELPKRSSDSSKVQPSSSLFGDSSDDDLALFGKTSSIRNTKHNKKKSLFDDDDEDDALFTSTPKVKFESKTDSKKKPLFSDDEDDDTLFGPLNPARRK